MVFPRRYNNLEEHLKPGKALVLYGPRRVGKTTLLQEYLRKTGWKYKLDSGDNIQTQELLGSQDFGQILPYAEGYDLYVIDEAQNVPHIGMALKIMVDQKPALRVIATGSSSFELAGQIGEPLTGRKTTLTLYPLAQQELALLWNHHELRERLEEFLLFGSYPEVLNAGTREEKVRILDELVNSYLLKDILTLETVKSSKILRDILSLLAFQIGNQVSLNEIANAVDVDVKTVQRYLDLLEKAFVIVSVSGFSRNLRSEVTSKGKYYFLDNGIRNGIIKQFNPLSLRNDLGQLWENFIFTERIKHRSYAQIFANTYFWRTYSQQEVDIVEEREGKLFGYECKWSSKKRVLSPTLWKETYNEALFEAVTPSNYLSFIT